MTLAESFACYVIVCTPPIPSLVRVYNVSHTQQVTASENAFWKACSFAVLFSKYTFHGGKKVSESFVKKTSRQKCRKRRQRTKQWKKYHRTTGSVLEKNKITRLVFFLDDAWLILSTYVTAKIKHGVTKVAMEFLKFPLHHSQVDLECVKFMESGLYLKTNSDLHIKLILTLLLGNS